MRSIPDKYLAILCVLPLFFNWVIGYTFFTNKESVYRQSLQFGLISWLFIGAMTLFYVLGALPFAGAYIAYGTPFLGGIVTLLYLTSSGFLIYRIYQDRPYEFTILQKWMRRLA